MGFALGAKSLAKLAGVHPDLVRVVKRAITLSEQDFTVFEGLRTQATQNAYLARGVTRVKFSQHMKQSDGLGHAVDLVPWISGGPRWEWPLIYPIADAMRQAAIDEGVNVRWGGIWDIRLNDVAAGADAVKKAVADYCVRHPGPDFIDGPHFELGR